VPNAGRVLLEVCLSIEIYSTDTDSGQISVIRRDHGAYHVVKEIPIGNAPRGAVKFTGDGRGYVSNTSANTVSEIDALTHREVARITVGFGPRGLGIVPGDVFMLVSNSGSNTVSIVDLQARKELAQIAVGRDPRHMAIDKAGRFAYVCVWGAGYVAKLDISGLADGEFREVREVARIRLAENAHPYSASIDPTGAFLFVACNSLDYLPVIDLSNDDIAHRVPLRCEGANAGARAVAFTPDDAFALVTLERTNEVAVITLADFTVTRYLPVGPSPRGIAIDPGTMTMFIAGFTRGFSVGVQPIQFKPHAVTIVDVSGVNLTDPEDQPRYADVQVGFGPCSVSVFDTLKIKHGFSQVDRTSVKA
jgi:YVTN family beta-propeller protein